MTETTTKRALDGSTSADSVSIPTGARTPADALGEPKRMSQSEPGEQEFYECPTCGKSLDTEHGMKTHHSMVHGESIAGETITCQQCGEEATFPPSTADGRKYCSEECMAEAYVEQTTATCEVCGDEYSVAQSREDSSRFCSRDCALPALAEERQERVSVVCSTCGGSFKTHPYRVEQQDHHFCDHDCYGKWISENQSGEDSVHWKGGYSKYRGTDWPALREKALEADDYQCQGCGRHDDEHREEHGVGLHVHHIRPITDFDDPADADTVDNLVPLCRDCHSEWEGIPLRPEAQT
jgi:5-methylcytosine-specific restriction endonuclease McrA